MGKKHLIKKGLAIALSAVLILAGLNIQPLEVKAEDVLWADITVDGITYKPTSWEDDNYTVKVKSRWSIYEPDFPNVSGAVTIPDTVEGNGHVYKVTAIGNNAFDSNSKITSVTIGSNVTSIEEQAFLHCSGLTSVTLPMGLVSMGSEAFAYSGITSVTIPNTVQSMGASCFIECEMLQTVTYDDNSNLKELQSNCFWGCDALKSINLPEGLERIGFAAFADCTGITQDVTIPESVNMIEQYAFCGIAINSIDNIKVIVNNATASIVGDAFEDAKTDVYLPLTITQPTSGGSISVASSENGNISLKEFVKSGDNISVTATPEDGYFLSDISVKNGSGDDVTVNSDYTFIMPLSGVSVTATFTEKTYTISSSGSEIIDFGMKNAGYSSVPDAQMVTITNTGNQVVKLSKGDLINYTVSDFSATTLAPGDTATCTIQPKSGLAEGTYVEGLRVSTENSTSVFIVVSFKVNGAFDVTIDPSSATIANGESQILTATPTGGSGTYTYKWYKGNETTEFATTNAVTVNPSESTTYKVVVNDTIEDKEIIATITVNPRTYTITYDANGGSGTMVNGSATEGVEFTLPACGFNAPEGKQFKAWAIGSANGSIVNADDSYTFTEATTVYAIWEDIPKVEVPVANPAAGSYTENQSVALTTATADAEIYYTTDGSTPSRTTGTKYSDAISVNGVEGTEVITTIKAVVVKGGMQDSEVTSFEYRIAIPDTTAPTAEITVGTNKWNSFWNTVTSFVFFKNTKEVTITGADGETGIAKIQYYLSDAELTLDEAKTLTDTDWTAYTKAFTLSKTSKQIIYAKITDGAGNFVVVNSNGIVVYEDSAQDTAGITHIKGVDGDQTAKVILNGNTVAAINDGSKTLIEGTDYTVAADGTITFKESYLESLAASDTSYTMIISYNPMGESFVTGGENEAPAETILSVSVVEESAPVIMMQPTDAIVVEGNTATFTIEATGTPELTYQWQINRGTAWEDIPDAISASYTTSVTVIENNGYKYRCVVTNRKASVISNEAILTANAAAAATYNINITTDGNGTALANITTAASGTRVTLTATPNEGYRFKEWKVLSGDVTIIGDTFTMPSSDVSIKAVFEKKESEDVITYKITDGANGTWVQDSDGNLVIRGNGEISKLVTVKVDGAIIGRENYTATSGSTVITLKKTYLDKLSVGVHTFEVVWTDGSASTTFIIKTPSTEDITDTTSDKTETPDLPKTGDSSAILLWGLVMIASGLGIAGYAVDKRRKKQNK